MKIVERTAYDEGDCRGYLKIQVDGKQVFSACDGEPEDNGLGRNFNDCYSIVDLMKQAYDAGQNNEPFGIDSKEVSWEDM